MRVSLPAIPDFADPSWQARQGGPQMMAGILNGKGTLMPAFGGRVNRRQAADLVAYIRAFGPAHEVVSKSQPAGDFEARVRALQRAWEELDSQLKQLPPNPTP